MSFQCLALGYNCVCLLTFRLPVWCHVTPPKLCLKYLSTSKIEWYYIWRDYSLPNSDLCKTSCRLHRCTFCDALAEEKIVTCSPEAESIIFFISYAEFDFQEFDSRVLPFAEIIFLLEIRRVRISGAALLETRQNVLSADRLWVNVQKLITFVKKKRKKRKMPI